MGYPAPAGFSRPSVTCNDAPLRAHPPAAAAAAVPSAANPSLAKPVDDAQLPSVGPGCKACCWVLLFVVLGVLVWVCVTESSPPEFKVSSLSVSPFNSSSSILKANWNISFAVRNPSYFSLISYERIQVSVLYHGVHLSTALVAPFSQYQRGESFLEANMEALSSLSSADNDVVSSIDRDLQDGAVNFTVAVDSTVSWNDNEKYWHRVTVSCDNMMVGQLSGDKAAGALVDGSRKCKARIDYYY